MKKFHASISINAPKEKVWETVIGEKTYPQWTEAFSPSSYVKGDWSQGSKILFLGKDEQGNEGGMVSTIVENRPYEFLSIKHLGFVNNGVEDTTSPEAAAWTPSFENYSLKEENGVTEFSLEQDMNEEFYDFFAKIWPLALEKLKDLAETGNLKTITVRTTLSAPIEKIWEFWTDPAHITKWTFASDDWEAPYAENDVRDNGKFMTRMSAKDGSSGFDFNGIYTQVQKPNFLKYEIEGGRKVSVHFIPAPGGIQVIENFEKENVYPEEQQRSGWQSILDNFKKYVESQS